MTDTVKSAVEILALIISVISLIISTRLKSKFEAQEEDLQSKRLFLSLWDKLVQVNRLNPQKVIMVDVQTAVNTLELVALLWEAGVVDKDMVAISFGDVYVQRHNELNQILTAIPGDNRTGPQLLSAHPAIDRILPEIQKKIANRAAFTPPAKK